MSTENKQTPVKKDNALDVVMNFIKESEQNGELELPKNYSAVNALKSAWLYLQEAVDKDKKPVLEVCSKASIVQALLKMVTKGLSVVKGQCYFVAYGGVLQFVESYQGKVAIAKRHGVTHVVTNAIYPKDVFEFEVDVETGLKRLTKHVQSLDTIDGQNIKGAYAVVTFEDGRKELTVMTKPQIVQAWNQRQGNGLTGAHNNFTDEMAKKTVSNRALKQAISTSDDSDLFDDEQPREQKPSIPQIANKESLSFDDHEEVKDEPKAIENNAPEPIKVNEAEKVKSAKAEKESKSLFDQEAGF